ncbi:hypothetical protein OIU77_012251 [Salix suchowensis]|uniref:Uncharacterized protein n=1 Tax=Salix suchowensis TaxID=1278906 RepID=A0ABQ9A3R8_9ROSI|nr:hypothetical protein OIU77_012251 [Salix suchowensis]
MVFRPFQELLPRHVGITMMIDEEKKLKQTGILDNIGLPESILELLVKLESSAVDSVEEVEVSDEETESTNETV